MPFSVSLSPPKSEIVLANHQVATKAFNLQNNSSSPIVLRLDTKQWVASDTQGGVSFIADPGPFQFSITNADLKDQTTFSIPPNSEKQIVVGIKPTSNNIQGDFYYTVFFSQSQEIENNPNTTQSTGNVGSHLLLHLGPVGEKNTAEVTTISLSPTFSDSISTNVTISGLVKNTGNKFFNLKGYIDIKKDNQTVKQLVLAGDTVLSGQSRTIRCIDNPTAKEPHVVPCILYSPNQPGLYTFTLVTTEDTILSGSTTATKLLFPYILLMGFFLVASIGFLFYKKTLLDRK